MQGLEKRKQQAIDKIGYMNTLAQRNPKILESPEYQKELKISGLLAISPSKAMTPQDYFLEAPEDALTTVNIDPYGVVTGARYS